MKKIEEPKPIGDILQGLSWRTPAPENPTTAGFRDVPPAAPLEPEPARPVAREVTAPVAEPEPEDQGRYDFDLAEFPLFRFYKNRLAQYDPKEPIVYNDIITGKDGQPVTREWKVYPRAGVGGPSTHALLFDLLQIYVEQGCRGSQIHFGTLRALFQRQGNRNPSQRDYDRMRRDIEILRNYDIHCKNAFWDKEKHAYIDMDWRLFNNVFYFKEKANNFQTQLPFGFVEVNEVLQQIARTRGFFATGFTPDFFHLLTPMEQRLSLYLSKFFMFQEVHYRFVDIIAKALPIEASREDNVRKVLKNAAKGLLEKNLPILKSYEFGKSAEGRWKIRFYRKFKPNQEYRIPQDALEELSAELEYDVERIIEATGNADDKPWWIQCAKRLGHGSIDRALGQLKETCQINKVKNKGGMLTKIFKDIAKERGIGLTE